MLTKTLYIRNLWYIFFNITLEQEFNIWFYEEILTKLWKNKCKQLLPNLRWLYTKQTNLKEHITSFEWKENKHILDQDPWCLYRNKNCLTLEFICVLNVSMFCRSLSVLLAIVHCLYFDVRLLITHLGSSNFSQNILYKDLYKLVVRVNTEEQFEGSKSLSL